MSPPRWLLAAVGVTALLGFALAVAPPKKADPYQGLYLSALCGAAFSLSEAADQAQTYHWTMHPRPDLSTDLVDVPGYLRGQRDFAVYEYNQAVDRVARKGVHAGRIDGRDPAWDCNDLLAGIPPAPADALEGQP